MTLHKKVTNRRVEVSRFYCISFPNLDVIVTFPHKLLVYIGLSSSINGQILSILVFYAPGLAWQTSRLAVKRCIGIAAKITKISQELYHSSSNKSLLYSDIYSEEEKLNVKEGKILRNISAHFLMKVTRDFKQQNTAPQI